MDKANGVTIGTPEDLSLNGSLGSFFARKGIVFDPESGLFRVDNEYASQVRLSGSGQRYAMMRKALQRNGIFAGRDVEAETHVETDGCTEEETRCLLCISPAKSRCVFPVSERYWRNSYRNLYPMVKNEAKFLGK